MPKMQIPSKLKPLVTKKKRFKIIIGGRGGAKSMTVSDIMLMKAQTESAKVLCLREFQASIDDSVFSVLSSEIERLEITGYEIQQNRILHNGEDAFKFAGMARNPESIKSKHGFKYAWIEEAQTVSDRSLKLLTPTIREDDSEIWMTANPRFSADPFSMRFIKPFEKELIRDGYYEDDLHLIIVINHGDNPWFPAELEKERLYDKGAMSAAEYAHVWDGAFYDSVQGAIIPQEWFDAAIDAHKTLGFEGRGAKVASHDPSDEGADAKGYALRHGSVVLDVREMLNMDVNDGCDAATELAIQQGADTFVWDCDGLGVTLKRQIRDTFEGKHCDYQMFKGSESVERPDDIYLPDESAEHDKDKRKTNKQTFRNKRAQYYWRLRDRFRNTYLAIVKGNYIAPCDMISLSSDIECMEQLRSEVCRIPKKPNNNGLIQIMSKPDMAKLEIPSPNMADALMMSMIEPKPVAEAVTLNFKSMRL